VNFLLILLFLRWIGSSAGEMRWFWETRISAESMELRCGGALGYYREGSPVPQSVLI
jgi:hypothetical protein